MEAKDKQKFHLIFVVAGAPGAGKGTLCKRLSQEHGFTHISVGDLLRQLIAKHEADDTIRDYVQRGEPLPMEWLWPILRARLDECTPGRPILLDGFPRRLDQAVQFEEACGEPSTVLFFTCPHEVAKKRVLERKLGRPGDTADIFERRYKEFRQLNPDVLDHYSSSKGSGKLVEVDTSGATESSYEKLLKALRQRQEIEELVGAQAQTASGGSDSGLPQRF
ncbi:hypothetical protein VTK26DRAFT_1863 [Humicola hyalothermophila]